MKLGLSEIWEFNTLAPTPKANGADDQWLFELIAGEVTISGLSTHDINDLKDPKYYDTELLPSIFTFREILWQPNIYPEPNLCIPQLNILKVFCTEFVDDFTKQINKSKWPFIGLLTGLALYCEEAVQQLTSINPSNKKQELARILGDFRRRSFPVIQFFIFHPCNRADYRQDAINRLNYSVKIMLTEYNNKFFELTEPYWEISTTKSAKKKIASAIAEANPS